MITKTQLIYYIRALIILTSITIAFNLALLALLISLNLYGYSQNNPTYICPTKTYYNIKYTNSYQILRTPFIFIMVILSVMISELVILILMLRRQYNRNKQEDQKDQNFRLSVDANKNLLILSILQSITSVLAVVPIGYYLTYLIQFNRQCSPSTDTLYIVILVGLSAAALIIPIICLYLIVKIIHLQQLEEDPIITPVQQKSQKPKHEQRYQTFNNNVQQLQNIHNHNQDPNRQQKQPLLNKSEHIQERYSIQKDKEQVKKSRFLDESIVTFVQQKPAVVNQIQQKPVINEVHQKPVVSQVHHKPMIVHVENNHKNKNVEDRYKQTISISKIPQNQPYQQQQVKYIQPKPTKQEKIINMNMSPPIRKSEIKKIVQSKQQSLSSNSDDQYYKRKRSKKRNKRHFQQQPHERDYYDAMRDQYRYRQDYYHRNPRRFNGYQDQPKYMLISPNSYRDFKYYVGDEERNERFPPRNYSQRRLSNSQKDYKQKSKDQKPSKQSSPKQQLPKPKPKKLLLASQVNQISVHSPIRASTKEQYSLTIPIKQQSKDIQTILQKDERQVYKQPQFIPIIINTKDQSTELPNNIPIKKFKQFSASIYKQLDMQEDMSKYRPFFDSKAAKTPIKQAKKPINMQQYIKSLNQTSKQDYFKQEMHYYLSQKNYSSILSEASNGKIPQQKQDHMRSKKMNLDDKKIYRNQYSLSQIKKNTLLDTIRGKYNQ